MRGHRRLTASVEDRPFGPTPWDDGLTYPGPWPERPVRLDGDRLVPLDAAAVDAALDAPEAVAVLALGSNGAPAQLHRKLRAAGLAVQAALLPVTVEGLASVFTTWVAPYGAIPTTATAARTAGALIVTVLDGGQAAAIDGTEGGYQRLALDPDVHTVRVAGSERTVPEVSCYVADHGVLVDPASGEPVTLRPQSALWAWLLAVVPGLAGLAGPTPATAVAALASDAGRRRAVADLLAAAGATAPARPPATRPVA